MLRTLANPARAKLRLIKLAVLLLVALATAADASLHARNTADNRALPKPVSKSASSVRSWNPKAAAAYLDQRETSWIAWSSAARDHGTFCISCHTALPYALARPALHRALAEPGESENERKLIDNITKRVRLWNEVQPYYSDTKYGVHKGAESRATEAVLNALVLASRDAHTATLSQDTRTAVGNMWALQQTAGENEGAWLWQQFNLKPWESRESQYYGAALAAAAAGLAPQKYSSAPDIQVNLKMLREYLQRKYSAQSALNHSALLWASTKWPDLLTSAQRAAIIQEIFSKQESDGGWNLFSLSKTARDWTFSSLFGKWKRPDGTPQDLSSDGFGTGFITFTLEEAGVSREDARLQRALSWLAQNQDKASGSWTTSSLNKRRNPESMTGQFMRDAGTAYAVLALTDAE